VRLDWSWAVAAVGIALGSFVQGLAGFGIGLVALSFLPYVMSPTRAIVLLTVYAVAFTLVVLVQLRRYVTPRGIAYLLIGTVLGMPFGVWVLANVPAALINRLIGIMLVLAPLLEWRGLYPGRLDGRPWGLGAGFLAGVLGGAVGTPGPPAIVYATTQGWSPQTIKANLQAFFLVNQTVILAGYWWAGLLTTEVLALTLAFAAPAALGLVGGLLLFGRVDQAHFRRIVFALIFVSGVALLVRG